MATISAAAYRELLDTAKYSDFVIDCQGIEFNVHRAVVCPQSRMLDLACSGPFEEASSGRIQFPEQSPDIMARAILFMYTSDYDDHFLPKFYAKMVKDEKDGLEDVHETHHRDIDKLGLAGPLRVNALLYGCADMLGIEELKKLASGRFMKDAEVAFGMDGFEEPLQLLYTNTIPDNRDLRFKVTTLCVENYDLLEIRPKTLKVLQVHEPNVYNVSVEILKRWMDFPPAPLKDKVASDAVRMAVAKYNENAQALPECNHMRSCFTSLVLRVNGDLIIRCSRCHPD